MEQVGVHTCSDGSHIHISRRGRDEMLYRGEALWLLEKTVFTKRVQLFGVQVWLAEKTGILKRTRFDRWGNKASYAIRGLSCRLGPYILTSSDLDVVLRALVMLRRSPGLEKQS